ncbi:hypothetical protein BSKO_13662 [Bryopsis sp. KO-2023]|nr:hypothetical protein BSKO_13662 [Bryopsis sp. KO-2023]
MARVGLSARETQRTLSDNRESRRSDQVPPISPSLRSNSFPGTLRGCSTGSSVASSSSTASLAGLLSPCLECPDSPATTSGRETTEDGGGDCSNAGPPKVERGVPFSKVVNRIGAGLGAVLCFLGWRMKKIKLKGEFKWGLVTGGLAGVALVRSYQRNRERKAMRFVAYNLPFDASASDEREKTDRNRNAKSFQDRIAFLNRALQQMWPFYETAVCDVIRDSVTPMLQSHKPSFINRIFFSKLTFGTIPFDITQVKGVGEGEDEFVIEVGIRWHGEADVALMVELKGGGAVQAKVQRLQFYASVRVTFTPLVPYFPGFGALTVALQRPPLVTFELSVGGLQIVGEQVKKFLHSFLVEQIFGNLLVWPNRFVVPILPPEQRGNLDHLYLRTTGVLRVVVKGAQDLDNNDGHNGYRTNVHPFVTLETVPLQLFTTKVLPSSQNPVWNEEHYLKVQELEQSLRVVLMDDHFDPGIMAPSTLRQGRKLGTCVIPLTSLPSGESVDRWFSLEKGNWDEAGPVRSKHHGQDILSDVWYMPKSKNSGVGRINLSLTYLPLDRLRRGIFPLGPPTKGRTHRGLLFLQLIRAFNLTSGKRRSVTAPYCVLCLGENSSKRSRVAKDSGDPEWNENFEWFYVSVKDELVVEILNEGKFMDTSLGFVKIQAESIALESKKTALGLVDATLEVQGGLGVIQMQLEWVPLDNNPIRKKRLRQRDVDVSRLGPSTPRGTLMVRLVNGRNLDNSDLGESQKTYCVLKVQGKEVRSGVFSGEGNPSWKETFSWQSVKGSDVLYVSVFSKGAMKDGSLGRCMIKLEECAKNPEQVGLVVKSLSDEKLDLPVGGSITVQLHWTMGVMQSNENDKMPVWPENYGR